VNSPAHPENRPGMTMVNLGFAVQPAILPGTRFTQMRDPRSMERQLLFHSYHNLQAVFRTKEI
jgi:hypothetical protein